MLLHARGLQRVQHRAGHVFLQQFRLDRGAAAPGGSFHARIGIRAALRVPPVMQPPAALRAGRDAGQQMRRGLHHVLTARRVREQLHQPLMSIHVDNRRPLRGRVLLALPFQQARPAAPRSACRAIDVGHHCFAATGFIPRAVQSRAIDPTDSPCSSTPTPASLTASASTGLMSSRTMCRFFVVWLVRDWRNMRVYPNHRWPAAQPACRCASRGPGPRGPARS